MSDFDKAIASGQSEKATKTQESEKRLAERQEQIQTWSANVRRWEQEVYYPFHKEANEALSKIGGRAESTNARPGVYNLRFQAAGHGQTVILKIELDGTLGTVKKGGYEGPKLGNIADQATTTNLKQLLADAVKKVAS